VAVSMIDTSFESVLVTASWAPSGEMAMLCGPSPTGIVCSTVTAWASRTATSYPGPLASPPLVRRAPSAPILQILAP
jgi:hypothetical protein